MRVKARPDVHDHIIDECDHRNLTPNKIYVVFEINIDAFRVLNDCDEPILYQKALFRVVDASIPPGWDMHHYEDGEYFIAPREVQALEPGFYERYFEKDPDIISTFDAIRKQAEA